MVKKKKYSDKDYLFQLTDHTGMNPVKLVVKLTEEEPLVELAEHDLNQRMKKYTVETPFDPMYVQQWHLHTHFNDPDYDSRSCAMCEDAWNLLDNYGSEEVVIAVSDDGCKMDHIDFDSAAKFSDWGYMRAEELITSVDISANEDEMYHQGSNHGTSCCGVMGAEIDAKLTVGAAPGCCLMPLQWESDGLNLFVSDSKLITMLNYIADKADVMSNSWGGGPRSLWALLVINRIKELAQSGGRRGKGIVFLWAAGNENCLINYTADQDVPYDNGCLQRSDGSLMWVGVSTTRVFENNLVGIPGVMHIAALASTAKRSHYSNYGPGISLCAPTNNSHEYCRMQLKGLGITTTTGRSGGVTSSFGGTSSATPLVAGIAALTISANPNLTALEVTSILKKTASKDLNFEGYLKTPPTDYDTDTSWDVSPVAPFDTGDFENIGSDDGSWSPWFGYGRVDAATAVAEALRLGLGSGSGDLVFQGSSSLDKSIPDNNTNGIKDEIICDKNFTIQSIKVHVDITHTYIGDLCVSLISPDGKMVKLHDREGSSRNDIHTDFSMSSLPSLYQFSGEQAQGTWILQVQDLAAVDLGRLQNWSLELKGEVQKTIYVEDTPGIIIPDNSSGGIERTLHVSENGQLKNIEVEIDITHSFIGDLSVELVSPDNTRVLLHNRTGGDADNIIKTYTMTNTSNLYVLQSEMISGDWKLKVSDHVEADEGKLNRWALKFIYS